MVLGPLRDGLPKIPLWRKRDFRGSKGREALLRSGWRAELLLELLLELLEDELELELELHADELEVY